MRREIAISTTRPRAVCYGEAGRDGGNGATAMRKTFLWIGGVLCGLGAAVIVASLVMKVLGVDASYNFGDPAKFQFVLVPFWQIGLGIAVAWRHMSGGVSLAEERRTYLTRTNSPVRHTFAAVQPSSCQRSLSFC